MRNDESALAMQSKAAALILRYVDVLAFVDNVSKKPLCIGHSCVCELHGAIDDDFV